MAYRVEEVALGELEIGSEIELDQVFNFAELFGWEAKNRYNVKSDNHELLIAEIDDPQGRSNQCHRQCCKANREWNLAVYQGPSDDSAEVLRMHKNQECFVECCGRDPTPCCGDRVLTVTNPSGELVGTAVQPQLSISECCSLGIQVNVMEEHKYNIDGSLYQCGRCLPMCFDAEFEITTADGGEAVGHVVRPALTCGEMCKKTNRIQIDFPEESDRADKAALMGGAMLYDIFEEMKQQGNDQPSSGGQ